MQPLLTVVDVSGSMGEEAKTQSVENSGLSLLDIVRHAVKTVVNTLDEHDRLALVTFSNAAKVIFNLTIMNVAGKASALRLLDTLEADGMTNLWDGLQSGMDILKNRPSSGDPRTDNSRNAAVLLLTDGVPNVEPPRGFIPMLKRYRDQNGGKFPGSISTFGFGYSLDSGLIRDMASEGGGMYAFIPDSGFVGTAFINALANILVTVADNSVLTLECVPGARYSVGADCGGYPSMLVTVSPLLLASPSQRVCSYIICGPY